MTIEELRALNEEKNSSRTRHSDPEHELQCTCVEYFRLKYPKEIIFAVPNGGQRDVRVARKMKAEGVTAGVPDLFVASARNGFNGLFIELKNGKKGRVSEKQIEMIEKLNEKGFYCCIVRTFDEFMATLKDYFGY